MKIYSGKKVDIAWSCLELPSGCRHWTEYITIKKPMKGGHTHNHLRNALERKLNKSKASRNRCHNYLNRRGFYNENA